MTTNLTATICDAPIRDKSREYAAISISFGIISAVFVIQRFAYKVWAKLEFGLDDWFTLITFVSGVPGTVLNVRGLASNGMGRDIWTLTPENITNFSMCFYVMELIYVAETSLLKLALLFFYVRIFPNTGVRRLLWATIVVVCLFGITFLFVATFQCNPVKYYWLKWDGNHRGKCLNSNAIAWSNAAVSIALDVWMLAIPLWQLRSLRLDWRKKIGVAMMFCVGTL